MRKRTNEEFSRCYEAFEREAIEAFLASLEHTGQELHEGIEYLIQERERLRDAQMSALEVASARLMKELAGVNQRKLLEELACFKDLLALQRRLLKENDEH